MTQNGHISPTLPVYKFNESEAFNQLIVKSCIGNYHVFMVNTNVTVILKAQKHQNLAAKKITRFQKVHSKNLK